MSEMEDNPEMEFASDWEVIPNTAHKLDQDFVNLLQIAPECFVSYLAKIGVTNIEVYANLHDTPEEHRAWCQKLVHDGCVNLNGNEMVEVARMVAAWKRASKIMSDGSGAGSIAMKPEPVGSHGGSVVRLMVSSSAGKGLVPKFHGRHSGPDHTGRVGRTWILWTLELGSASSAVELVMEGSPDECRLRWQQENVCLEVNCRRMQRGNQIFLWNDDPPVPTASHSTFVLNQDGSISPHPTCPGACKGNASDLALGLSGSTCVLVGRNDPKRFIFDLQGSVGGQHHAQHKPRPSVLVPQGDARSLHLKDVDLTDGSIVDLLPKADDKVFRLVAATDKTQAIGFNARHEINDQWNLYGGSVRLGPLVDSATFKFALDGKHVSYIGDEFLGIEINCGQVVEGGSCQLLRTRNRGQGESGWPFVQNEDDTLSPAHGRSFKGCFSLSHGNTKSLVLGFGPITYDSWQSKPQAPDSIGGLGWQHLGLVAKNSPNRLLVEATVPSSEKDKSVIAAVPAFASNVKEGNVLSLELSSQPGQGLVPTLQGRHGKPGERRWHLWHLKLGPASAAGKVRIEGSPSRCSLVWEEEGAGLEVDCGLMEVGTTLWLGKHGKRDEELGAMRRPCCLYTDGTVSPADAPHLVFGFNSGWATDCGGKHCAQHKAWPAVLVPRGDARSLRLKCIDLTLDSSRKHSDTQEFPVLDPPALKPGEFKLVHLKSGKALGAQNLGVWPGDSINGKSSWNGAPFSNKSDTGEFNSLVPLECAASFQWIVMDGWFSIHLATHPRLGLEVTYREFAIVSNRIMLFGPYHYDHKWYCQFEANEDGTISPKGSQLVLGFGACVQPKHGFNGEREQCILVPRGDSRQLHFSK